MRALRAHVRTCKLKNYSASCNVFFTLAAMPRPPPQSDWQIQKWPGHDGFRVVHRASGASHSLAPVPYEDAREQLRLLHKAHQLPAPRVRKQPPKRYAHVGGGSRATSAYAKHLEQVKQANAQENFLREQRAALEAERRAKLTPEQRRVLERKEELARWADIRKQREKVAANQAAADAARKSGSQALKEELAKKTADENAARAAPKDAGFFTNIVNKLANATGAATSTSMPPNVKKILGEIGNEEITSMYAARAPVAAALEGALSLLAAGKWEGAKAAGGFDKVYHLRLIINGKYTLEKVERVSLTRGVGEPSETCKIPLEQPDPSGQARYLPVKITIGELYSHAQDVMGEQRFYAYDAFTNNCQAFVATVLQANGLLTPTVRAFVVQDAETLLKHTPEYLSGVARTLTNVGNIANRAIQGGAMARRAARATNAEMVYAGYGQLSC